MKNDVNIIRELIKEYKELPAVNNFENLYNLHKSTNDLKPVRPTVCISEIPWGQMNFDGSLSLRCEDKFFQKYERELRQNIFQAKHFACDNMFEPVICVPKIINADGYGIQIKEETLMADDSASVKSHKYEDQFECEEDIDKIRNQHIEYDEVNTLKNFEIVSNAFSDLIDVRIQGEETGYVLGFKSWDIIASYMSIDNLMINLMDEPEFMHKLVRRLTDAVSDTIEQYDKLKLFDSRSRYVHSSPTPCSALEETNDKFGTSANMWGRALAQILASVSPQMHDEFDISYVIDALKKFPVVYYGCCEPLDRKIDIVKKIPNLRKISITPWADVNVAAQGIKSDYVMSAKPNPAFVATNNLDEKLIKNEISNIVNACKKNNCPCEILLKDISTVENNPQTLFKWAEIAMNEVK